VIPLMQAANELPPIVPTMLAFVAAAPVATPAAPPPPPPAAAMAAARPIEPARSGALAAPIEAPADVLPERAQPSVDATAGVPGGVEGGVPGGVVGGIVGGIASAAPPPPPPPPPAPAVPQLVHIGGQITAPALLHRVEPVYPDVAQKAHIVGIVILEARVDTDGCVDQVTVLRSRHLMLDKAAEQALLQWRYSPLVLNGIPTPFVLTVTFNFSTQ
jgi:protein TonB